MHAVLVAVVILLGTIPAGTTAASGVPSAATAPAGAGVIGDRVGGGRAGDPVPGGVARRAAGASQPAAGASQPIAGAPLAGVPQSVAGAPVAGVPRPQAAFGWPLAGFPAVLRGFDAPEHRYGAGHRGVDLAGRPDQEVLAAGDGVVAFAGMVAGRPVVSVDHPNGLRTTYEPVTATVLPGQRVSRGQPIGVLQAGHAGCPATACLHWGVRRGEEYLDPLWLLSPGRVRLLPALPG